MSHNNNISYEEIKETIENLKRELIQRKEKNDSYETIVEYERAIAKLYLYIIENNLRPSQQTTVSKSNVTTKAGAFAPVTQVRSRVVRSDDQTKQLYHDNLLNNLKRADTAFEEKTSSLLDNIKDGQAESVTNNPQDTMMPIGSVMPEQKSIKPLIINQDNDRVAPTTTSTQNDQSTVVPSEKNATTNHVDLNPPQANNNATNEQFITITNIPVTTYTIPSRNNVPDQNLQTPLFTEKNSLLEKAMNQYQQYMDQLRLMHYSLNEKICQNPTKNTDPKNEDVMTISYTESEEFETHILSPVYVANKDFIENPTPTSDVSNSSSIQKRFYCPADVKTTTSMDYNPDLEFLPIGKKIKQDIEQSNIEHNADSTKTSQTSDVCVDPDIMDIEQYMEDQMKNHMKTFSFPENDAHIVPSSIWGPGAWAFLESKFQWTDTFRPAYTDYSHENGMEDDKTDQTPIKSLAKIDLRDLKYLLMLQYILPTLQCRANFIEYFHKNPPKVGESKGKYIYMLHNDVNRRKGVPEFPEKDAIARWTQPNFYEADGTTRKNTIIFRGAITYARNSFYGMRWDGISEIESALWKFYGSSGDLSLNKTIDETQGACRLLQGCKVVRIFTCRNSVFVLYRYMPYKQFLLCFYSALRDETCIIGMFDGNYFPKDHPRARFSNHEAAFKSDDGKITHKQDILNVIGLRHLWSLGDKDLIVWEFGLAEEDTTGSSTMSTVSFTFDMINEYLIWEPNKVFNTIHKTYGDMKSPDPVDNTQIMHTVSGCKAGGIVHQSEEERKLFRKSLIDYVCGQRQSGHSYFTDTNYGLLFEEISLRDYRHNVYPYVIMRNPGETNIEIHKLNEKISLDKKTDLDEKNISLHMPEDNWQTGIYVYFQNLRKFQYVPLNPFNNGVSSDLNLDQVMEAIKVMAHNLKEKHNFQQYQLMSRVIQKQIS